MYLTDLIEGLKQTFDSTKQIEFNIKSEEIKISIEHAVPCSLILNEVIINAFKHAFDGINEPLLEISISKNGTDVELLVCDNGVGIENTLTTSSTPSLGSKLIDILTQQIDGKSEYVEGPTSGTCFKLTFPIQ